MKVALTITIAGTMLVLGATTDGALGPLLSVLGLAPLVGWAVFGAPRPERRRIEPVGIVARRRVLRALVVDRV